MARQKRNRSDGWYAATLNKSVLILPTRSLKTALKAGFAVQPLASYLASVYRETDNPLVKALIAANYPECTNIQDEQHELPFE